MTPEQHDQHHHDLTVVVKVLSAFIVRKVNTDRDGKVHEWFRYVLPDGTIGGTNNRRHAIERMMAEVLKRVEL